MKILSLKPGHDGTIVYLSEGQLMFSLEGEKFFQKIFCCHRQSFCRGDVLPQRTA